MYEDDHEEEILHGRRGYDNIDLKACEEKSVATNTPGQNSNDVAQLVFEMMLLRSPGIAREDFIQSTTTGALQADTAHIKVPADL